MKLNKFIKNLSKIKEEFGDLEVIYSSQFSEQDYEIINYNPIICQIHDLKSKVLAIVGLQGEDISDKDINAIIIN